MEKLFTGAIRRSFGKLRSTARVHVTRGRGALDATELHNGRPATPETISLRLFTKAMPSIRK